MKITIKGKTEHCSKEFLRSWAYATGAVASLHNMEVFDITIRFVSPTAAVLEKNPNAHGKPSLTAYKCEYWAGLCSRGHRLIHIKNDASAERTAQIMLHELIHMWIGPFPDVTKEDGTKVATEEKITSTLTSKLLPEIKPIAEMLCEGYYRRAAYLAHTKIAYKNKKSEDWYDPAQWERIGIKDGRTEDNLSKDFIKKLGTAFGEVFGEETTEKRLFVFGEEPMEKKFEVMIPIKFVTSTDKAHAKIMSKVIDAVRKKLEEDFPQLRVAIKEEHVVIQAWE